MTQFDDIFAAAGGVAERLHNQFGTTAVLRRTTKRFDAVEGKSTETTTDFTLKITPPISGVDTVGAYRKDVMQNTTVPINEITVSFAAVGLSIEPNATTDKLLFRGAVYQIVRVLPVVSGDSIAMWQVQAKQ